MLLGGVFKATGNAESGRSPAKMALDARRPAALGRHWGVPLAFNPHFPINTLTMMRGAAGMQMREPASFDRYLEVIFHAMWREPRNLATRRCLPTCCAGGFDPERIAALAADPEVKARLRANTEEAVARGVFGAPTFFVDGAMFFGQDRLDFSARRARARIVAAPAFSRAAPATRRRRGRGTTPGRPRRAARSSPSSSGGTAPGPRCPVRAAAGELAAAEGHRVVVVQRRVDPDDAGSISHRARIASARSPGCRCWPQAHLGVVGARDRLVQAGDAGTPAPAGRSTRRA